MYWPAFLLIGLQFGSILALAAGILCIIPYIGPFIAFYSRIDYCLSGFHIYGSKIRYRLVCHPIDSW